MPSYEELKKLGLIKNYNDRLFVNQEAQNIIQSDNKKGESTLKEVQEDTKFKKINFTHKNDSFAASSTELSISSLERYYNIPGRTLPSMQFNNTIKDLSSLEGIDTIKQDAQNTFNDKVVDSSIEYERNAEASFKKIPIDSLQNKTGILEFLNSFFDLSKAQSPTFEKILDESIKANFINTPYAAELIAERLAGNIEYKKDSWSTKEEKALYNLIEELKSGIQDVPRFAGFISVLINQNGKADSEQAKKSGRVLVELIQFINMRRLARAYDIEGHLKLEAVGGEGDPEFLKRIKGKTNPDEILKEAEIYAQELTEKVITRNNEIVNKKLKEKKGSTSQLSIASKFQSGGGSAASKLVHAADLKALIGNDDIFIDVKSGISKSKIGEYQARYTAATDTITSIEKIYKRSILNDNSLKIFIANLEIIISYMYYKVIKSNKPIDNSHDIYKQLENSSLIKNLITYMFLTSLDFIEYVQNVDSGKMKQPTFVLTVQGFIWYSDFLRLISDALFETSGGNKVRFGLRYAFVDIEKLSASKKDTAINSRRNDPMVKNAIAFIEKARGNTIEEEEVKDFLKFVNLFVSENQIYYKLELDNVFNRVNTNIKKYVKK